MKNGKSFILDQVEGETETDRKINKICITINIICMIIQVVIITGILVNHL